MSGTGEVIEVALDDLAYGPNVRRERVSHDHVNALEPFAASLPPIVVRKVKTAYEVIDGMHRWQVAKRIGSPTIKAVVIECGDAEAFEQAIKSNIAHGLPLTLDERKTAAVRLIKASDWSDRRIADTCGIDHKTVGSLRPTRPSGENPQLANRQGADGRTRPANPGVAAAHRRRILEALTADPEASDRDIAAKAKASRATVADVRRETVTESTTLTLVPDAATAVTVEDIAPSWPSDWRQHSSFETSDNANRFCNFMHRWSESTRFDREAEKVAGMCPPSAIDEAVRSSRAMAASHTRFADELEQRQPLRGVQ
jgi:ParB-like chromosome segregation protein Spo0J